MEPGAVGGALVDGVTVGDVVDGTATNVVVDLDGLSERPNPDDDPVATSRD